MMRQKIYAILAACLMTAAASVSAEAQTISQLCTPKVTVNEIVVSPKQRYDAGRKAEPPLTDMGTGFAWPDTPVGVIKTTSSRSTIIPAADHLESLECVYVGIQGTQTHPTVQGDRQARRVSGGPFLTIVLALRGGLGADRCFFN
jgi:hypothetical protein